MLFTHLRPRHAKSPSNPLETAWLLTIVSNSEGRLDKKYSSSAVLIKENYVLRKAWNDGPFKQIRNLSAIAVLFLLTRDSDADILRPSPSFQTGLGVTIEQSRLAAAFLSLPSLISFFLN